MRKALILIIWFCFLFFTAVNSQVIKSFSLDSAEFNQEIEIFFKTNRSEEAKLIIEDFMVLWNSKAFEEGEYPRIQKNLNKLLNFNLKAVPDFTKYLNILISFIKTDKNTILLKRWQEVFYSMLDMKKIKINTIKKYMDFSYQFINNQYIYHSQALSWKASSENFQFHFDKTVQVKFLNTTLTCFAKRDSISIYQTGGILYPIENRWEGKKGLVSWERSNYPVDSVKAELTKYVIHTNKSEYNADSVLFTNLYYLSVPVWGRLHDKVKLVTQAANVQYPQFSSFDNNYHWTEMYPNIDYDGGFSFQGSRIVGHTTTGDDVVLSLKYQDTVFMKIRSKFVIFLPKKVISNKSSITLYYKNDSIFHPDLLFTYFVDRREMTFNKNKDFLSSSPYHNTFHQVLMNFDQVIWKTNESFMSFTMPRSVAIGNANFQSLNYYDLYDYEKQQAMDETHPLILIRKYARKTKSRSFNAVGFAHYINKPVNQTRQLLMRLTVEGYILFNPETDIAFARDKLYAILEARFKKRDYDVLDIKSTVQNPNSNATLNLANFDISINGVNRIFLSDSQKVFIYPANGKVILKKNRNLEFDGVVIAGLFTFFGNGFHFDYSKFKINLENVDSLKMRAATDERDFYNDPVLMRVNQTIENITGEILIDEPDNKSGLKSLSQFPIFISKKNSFIYYDEKSIQNGVYERETFYFEVYPYTIDSLDNFNKDALRFEGFFVSDDIFPTFEDQVYIMPDQSLGFIRSTPDEGFPVYKGKGKYYDKISLSNQGLRGRGKITYLTSTIQSDDYIFLPDSMNTTAKNFNIAKQKTGIEYPYVEAENIQIHWEPYKDVLFAHQIDKPYKIFNKNTTLDGSLALKPTGLVGSGSLRFENAEYISNQYTYDADAFLSDTVDFTLRNTKKDSILFATKEIKARYNFINRTGDFASFTEANRVAFPANQYIAFVKEFKWKGKENLISLTSNELVHVYDSGEFKILPLEQRDDNPIGNHFMSINKRQDSLDFVSSTAQFKINERKIIADRVNFIKVADAYVYPYEGYVEVNEKAKMGTLQNSEIIASRENELHKFYNARVNVYGKNSYTGAADYDYMDEFEVPQMIHFKKIYVGDSIRTNAEGVITDPDNFYLSSKFAYQGKVKLVANREFLTFDGATKINHLCKTSEPRWIRFESEIDPKNIFIPYPEEPRDINGVKIYSGDFIKNDSVHIYTSFVSSRKTYSDNPLTNASGYLHYDKSRGEFVISSLEKIQNRDTTGNLISLFKDLCIFHAEGDLGLGVKFGHFKVKQLGTLNHDLEKENINFDLIMHMDFHFSQPALELMAMEIDSLPGNEPINMLTKSYNKKMNEFVGPKNAAAMKEDLLLYGDYRRLPKEFDHTMVLTHLDLKWNHETGSYRSDGKIGIATIGKRQIHKLYKGNLEIIKKRSGDIFHLYIEIDRRNWYFLSYTRGVMQCLSSSKIFNNIIQETKPKERKLKGATSQNPYIYILATDNKFKKTKERFREKNQENSN